VQRFEICDKSHAQDADLAGGKANAVLSFKIFADFLPLTTVNKALNPDVDHDVISDRALGRNQFRQGCGMLHYRGSLLFASGDADAHGLARVKGPVLQGHAAAWHGF